MLATAPGTDLTNLETAGAKFGDGKYNNWLDAPLPRGRNCGMQTAAAELPCSLWDTAYSGNLDKT